MVQVLRDGVGQGGIRSERLIEEEGALGVEYVRRYALVDAVIRERVSG